MTDTDKIRFVATALGLIPATAECDGQKYDPSTYRSVCGRNYSHEAHTYEPTPPNFTQPAGADLLLRTLARKDLTICVSASYLIIHDRHGANLAESLTGVHQDWKPALLDAAYRLLKTDEGT
jgi:hypothetical protein